MTAQGDDNNTTATVHVLRSLADPSRLASVAHLALAEHRVVDLSAHLGLAPSTGSRHWSWLRDCGPVTARAGGRASLYSLAKAEVLDLLSAAERFLDATGRDVALCPSSGTGTTR